MRTCATRTFDIESTPLPLSLVVHLPRAASKPRHQVCKKWCIQKEVPTINRRVASPKEMLIMAVLGSCGSVGENEEVKDGRVTIEALDDNVPESIFVKEESKAVLKEEERAIQSTEMML